MCKTCNKCKITYEDVEENFHKKLESFHHICKSCKRKYDLSIADIRRERSKLYPSQSKERRKESRKKASEQAKINAYNNSKKYRTENREKFIASVRSWKQNNPQKEKEYSKKINQRIVTTLPDSYIIRLIRMSVKNNEYLPPQEEVNTYRRLTILRREKLQFMNQIKQELNIKSL